MPVMGPYPKGLPRGLFYACIFSLRTFESEFRVGCDQLCFTSALTELIVQLIPMSTCSGPGTLTATGEAGTGPICNREKEAKSQHQVAGKDSDPGHVPKVSYPRCKRT